jgi:4-amino-4-deoxy-L-arabinose transferase-like glycosyltransferase
MNERADWLHPWDEFKDSPYSNKPPLLLWMVAGSIKVLGFSTLSARIPSALFIFLSFILLWRMMATLYSRRAALFALLLLCANRTFFRSVLELNFEGIVLLGSLSCLYPCLRALRGRSVDACHWALFACGIFLLFQSKPPYILFVLLPIFGTAIVFRRFRQRIFCAQGVQALLVGTLCGQSTYLFYTKADVERALVNQVEQPFIFYRGYLLTIANWMRAILVDFAPLSWFGLVGAWISKRRLGTRSAAEHFFLLLWLLPALGIICALDFKARYLIVPFLSLVIFGARQAAVLCRNTRFCKPATIYFGIGAICCLLVGGLGVQAHEENGLLTLAKQNPALASVPVPVCVRGAEVLLSKPSRKRAGMMLELYLGKKFPIYMHQTLGLSSLGEKGVFLAEDGCVEELTKAGARFTTKGQAGKAFLLQLDAPLPESTRSTVDDSRYFDYH